MGSFFVLSSRTTTIRVCRTILLTPVVFHIGPPNSQSSVLPPSSINIAPVAPTPMNATSRFCDFFFFSFFVVVVVVGELQGRLNHIHIGRRTPPCPEMGGQSENHALAHIRSSRRRERPLLVVLGLDVLPSAALGFPDADEPHDETKGHELGGRALVVAETELSSI